MIESIRQFFELNSVIILFIYGQVFFILGLAITLQSLRYSRLPLARHLHWLALFGYTHALNEWGDIFIPIQAQYLPESIIHLLITAQTVILAMSFAFLLQFGIESLRPLPGRWRYIRFLPLIMFLIWLFWMLGIQYTSSQSGGAFSISRAKMSGRVWSPMAGRSAKPFVTARAVGSPFRSSRALVAMVVPIRIQPIFPASLFASSP